MASITIRNLDDDIKQRRIAPGYGVDLDIPVRGPMRDPVQFEE
jgi:hypothetical protein